MPAQTGKAQWKSRTRTCVRPEGRPVSESCASSFPHCTLTSVNATDVQRVPSVPSRGGARKAYQTKMLLCTKAKNAFPPEKEALARVT